MVYTIIVTLLTALPAILYILYCKKHFYEYSKIRMIKNKSIYKEMFNYSIWIGYGAIASIAKNQGSGLIVNRFFNTVMNASLGIANTINHAIQMIAYNLGKSMTPQITKSYACGNINRSESLVIACSKYTFLLLLLTASPFIVETEYIINLWLGEVPPNSKSFVILLIIDSLIISLNNGIPELIFASGKIKWYQIIVNTLSIFSVIVGFIVLSKGYPAHYLYYTYITFSLIILIIRQFVLNIVIKINNWRIIKDSYFPCFIISILFYVYLQINIKLNPIINIIITFVYLSILIFLIGLKKIDRKTVYTYVINLIHKH
jgi:O-antigen/teichoic acid export membrane protein